MAVTHRIDEAALRRVLAGSGVREDMLRRGGNVAAVARRLAGRDTGALAASIAVTAFPHRGSTGVRVGSPLEYARWHHDGTGTYGPSGQPIRPRRARFLVFVPKGGTQPVFARQVRGSPGTHYLSRALPAARR